MFIFKSQFSVCDTDKTILLTFQGDSIAADGHDGVVHVILILQRRVDVHHLKVHWNAAEPATETHKEHEELTLTSVWSTLWAEFRIILANLKTSLT